MDKTTNPTTPTSIEHLQYNPSVEKVLGSGSMAIVGRLKPGVVLKYPRFSWWATSTAEDHYFIKDIKHSFIVEEKILRILGPHPNLVKYNKV